MNDYVNKYMYAESTDDTYLFLKVYRDKGCTERAVQALRTIFNARGDCDFVQVHFTNHKISQIKWIGRATQEDIARFLDERGFSYDVKKDTLAVGKTWCANSGKFLPNLLSGVTVSLL